MNINEEQLCFYHELGFAATQWGALEASLYNVYLACFKSGNEREISVSFLSVENFRSKLGMVDNIIHAQFRDDACLDEWIDIFGRVESARKARNSMIHAQKFNYLHHQSGRRIALVPWLSKTPRKKPRKPQKLPPGSLCVKDIALLAKRFAAISNLLLNFSFRLYGRPPPLPESSTQEPSPPKLHELVRRTRALLASPPQS